MVTESLLRYVSQAETKIKKEELEIQILARRRTCLHDECSTVEIATKTAEKELALMQLQAQDLESKVASLKTQAIERKTESESLQKTMSLLSSQMDQKSKALQDTRSERARQALRLQQQLKEETKLIENLAAEDCPTVENDDGTKPEPIPSSSMEFGETLLAMSKNEYMRGLILELLSESELLEWKEDIQRNLGDNGVSTASSAGK
ncbi:hypothetical protein NDN08_000847 [Rhodosorus marinus]|uniref:GRIP domain-containing protein n=1 Tax=Rhodosorus marinus TaxID=101924 RepID=A0AAV8UP92_9RHOD|nr:hypothetical protein NDN08_000847 [Rhodosorus marinus]